MDDILHSIFNFGVFLAWLRSPKLHHQRLPLETLEWLENMIPTISDIDTIEYGTL